MNESKIAAAQSRSVHARSDLAKTLDVLKDRLLPRTIARNIASGLVDKGGEVAQSSVDAARARPALTVGIAALATLFFARKPILRAISSADYETEPTPARSHPKPD